MKKINKIKYNSENSTYYMKIHLSFTLILYDLVQVKKKDIFK